MPTTLPQFPSPPGSRNQFVTTVTGPASYTQIGVASPPTGGFTLSAADLGMVSFDWVSGGASDDGQYYIEPIFDNNPAKEATSVRFCVKVLATGAQAAGATNLSARTFRVWGFGF